MSESKSPPGSRRRKADLRRQEIIDAATELFAQFGFASTSTKRIAQTVGVTEGLIFHYFPTKVELLRAVARQRRGFIGEVQALLADAVDQPATEVLQHLVLGWTEAVHRQSDLIRMLLVESQTNPELEAAFQAVVGDTVDAMTAYLASRVAAGELRRDLATRTSAMMFFSSLMLFFLANRSLPAELWNQRAGAFTAEMLHVWFEGALAPSDNPVPGDSTAPNESPTPNDATAPIGAVAPGDTPTPKQ